MLTNDNNVEYVGRSDVVVIGCGMAGLTCASKLKQHCNVLLLEGRNRIGGRINTYDSQGVPVELGASFIHGYKTNPVYHFVVNNNIKLSRPRSGYQLIYDFDGTPQHVPEGPRSYYDSAIRFIEEQQEFLRQNKNLKDQSLQDALDAYIQKHPKPWPPDSFEERYFQYKIWVEEEFDGDDLSELSLRGYEEDLGKGGNVCIKGGYKVLVDTLAKDLQIKLETKVKVVKVLQEGVEVITDKGTFYSKFVVVTLPLGVLKSNSVTFIPPLPTELRSAIDGLRMAIMDKCALHFDKPFWPPSTNRIIYTSAQRGEWPWMDVVKGGEEDEVGEAVLLCWTSGSYAKDMEKRTDKEIVDRLLEILRELFGYTTTLKEVKISRWKSDEFCFGTWTYVPVGTDSALCCKQFSKTIHNRLFFAGEHVHEPFMGAIHGAFVSGLEVATQVGQALGFTMDS